LWEVTLNQTGTEDAQGTFQRIQQAVLQAGVDKEKDPQLTALESIAGNVDYIYKLIMNYLKMLGFLSNMDPSRIAEGAIRDATSGGVDTDFALWAYRSFGK